MNIVLSVTMTSGEYPTIDQDTTFEDAVRIISKLVSSHRVISDEEDAIYEFPGWDGTVRKLELDPVVASHTGLGEAVRARIIGDYQTGIAIIMRSRNLFDARRYGFYLQPESSHDEARGLQVWEAPAEKPKRSNAYWGFELLDEQQAKPSSPEITESLIRSLRIDSE